MASLPCALSLSLLFLLVPGPIPGTDACSTPPAGCTIQHCKALKNLNPPTSAYMDKLIGWYYGVYNKNINGGNPVGSSSQKGSGIVNWEVFPAVETEYLVPKVDSSNVKSLSDCCTLCAQTDGCYVYMFFTSTDITQIPTGTGNVAKYHPYNFYGDQQCFLLTGGNDKSETQRGTPFSGTHSQQISSSGYPNKYYPPSWVGGMCNGNASVIDDPHFLGAHGTRFEFNGDVNKTFALITDEKMHINVKLGGFLDSRTSGEKDSKAVRTWIKEIGMLWKDGEGEVHTALLVARAGESPERGKNGFLAMVQIDGHDFALPVKVGDKVTDGLFSLELAQLGKKGIFDMDTFELTLGGLLTVKLRMRAAHPLLRSPGEAHVHFNFHIVDMETSSKVHGVLGQTFRNTVLQSVRSLEYRILNSLLGAPIVADGYTGRGFLDGETSDYETTGILATDSKFSVFAA